MKYDFLFWYLKNIDTLNGVFIRHSKKLGERLINGISKSYSEKEPEIVKKIVDNIRNFKTHGKTLHIETNSIFIHGSKSIVEFEYYGKNTKRELGDVVFILSYSFNKTKVFERVTINQIKKSKGTIWHFNSKSGQEQLYLLSRLPKFKGVKGMIPKSDFIHLHDNSGCLGTYGLLYSPGDIALIDAKTLSVVVSVEKKVTLNTLLKIEKRPGDIIYPLYCILLSVPRSLMQKLCEYFGYKVFLYNKDCISYNAYDFSLKYLQGKIGEVIFFNNKVTNASVFSFMQKMMQIIRSQAERKKDVEVFNFINTFEKFSYNLDGSDFDSILRNENIHDDNNDNHDEDNDGFGIIYTNVTINEM